MQKLFIANWKSNKNVSEARNWLETFETRIKPEVALNTLSSQIVICPPFPLLSLVSEAVSGKVLHEHVSVGVQDLSPFPAGSYTGAVSARNVVDFGVKYAVLGHSERRRHFNESSSDVAKKVEQCLEAGITPVICVDHDEFETQANALDKIEKRKIIIAYEPVDHIGTGEGQELSEVIENVTQVNRVFGDVRVIYGGSVNPDNLEMYLSSEEITGFLVGSASLDAEQFASMVKRSSK